MRIGYRTARLDCIATIAPSFSHLATLQLDIIPEEGITLLGIRTSWSEHRLVWQINRLLGMSLARMQDFVIESQPVAMSPGLFSASEQKEFSVFYYEEDHEQAILVANLGEGIALYGKHKPFDYLLKLESGRCSLQEAIEVLQEERGILALAVLDCPAGSLKANPFNDYD